MAAPRICSIPDCGKPSHLRGWCIAHYTRWRRHGDPLGGRTRGGRGSALRYFHDVVVPYEGDDCLIWTEHRNMAGYGLVYVDGKHQYVSRLACREVNGPPPTDKHVAAHNCGNGHLGCVNPRHMRWATAWENAQDAIAHGRLARGRFAHGRSIRTAKLTDDDVRRIRSLKGTMTQAGIGRLFNIGAPHVCRILKGEKWGHLD